MPFPKPEDHIDKAKRPRPGCPLDPKVVSKLIAKHNGNLSRVAEAIGSTRGAIRGVVDRNPDLQAELAQARERVIDELETAVETRAIESNDTTLQIFLLKTRGRSRGYDQLESVSAARDVATAAFDFISAKARENGKPSHNISSSDIV